MDSFGPWSDKDGIAHKLFGGEMNAGGIYRGAYGVDHHDAGKWACRYLKKYFAGPSCSPAWQAAGVCSVMKTRRKFPAQNLSSAMITFWKNVDKEDYRRQKGANSSVYALYPHDRMAAHGLGDSSNGDEVVAVEKRLMTC